MILTCTVSTMCKKNSHTYQYMYNVLNSIFSSINCFYIIVKKPSQTMLLFRFRLNRKKKKKQFTGSKISNNSFPKLLFQSSLEPSLGLLHELRTQSEHQNAKLHLIECPVAVQIALSHHALQLVVSQALQPENRRVPLQALECNYLFLAVHQQAKPIAQLFYQALPSQFIGHDRQQVFELCPCGRRIVGFSPCHFFFFCWKMLFGERKRKEMERGVEGNRKGGWIFIGEE